uniref:LITAF domain-containing protein n=1 Tax=Steinernema glaseri TaxID=37863 RepID=A0A1I7ZI49_9BILA
MLRMTDAPPPYSPVDPSVPNPFGEAPPLQEKHATISIATFADPAIFVATGYGEGVNPADGAPTQPPEVQVKKAPTRKPYDAYCVKCQTLVHTERRFVSGAFTWTLFVVLLLVFFPLCWVPFVVRSIKDVEHLCPQCDSLLAVRRMVVC